MASQKDPFDSMDKAFKSLGEVKLVNTEHLHENWEFVQQYPLSQRLLAMSHVWESLAGNEYIIAAKGAPESIMDLCHLDNKKKAALEVNVTQMAGEGLRVIGVAKAICSKTTLPVQQHDFEFEFIGLVGLEDPIRETVPDAVKECYDAGIRVIMITGDYPITAQNIAQQIGLKDREYVITGPELDTILLSILQGVFSLLAVLGSYQLGIFIGKMQNLNPESLQVKAKTLAFATLIVSNLCLILVNRSWSKSIFSLIREYNAALLYVTAGALIFLSLVINVPFLQDLFHFGYIHVSDVIIALCLGILSIAWFELVKIIAYKRKIRL